MVFALGSEAMVGLVRIDPGHLSASRALDLVMVKVLVLDMLLELLEGVEVSPTPRPAAAEPMSRRDVGKRYIVGDEEVVHELLMRWCTLDVAVV